MSLIIFGNTNSPGKSWQHRWLYSCLASIFILQVFAGQPASAKNIFYFLGFRHQVKDTEAVTITSATASTSPQVKTMREPHEYVSCRIIIKAPVDVVWQTVHFERDAAPDLVSNTLLEGSGNHSVFEQKWTVVPLLSRTTCVIDEMDYPNTRIDYKLLKSDEFKVMEGSWLFSPSEDGYSTTLELTAHLEPRRPAPMLFLKSVAKRKMAKRLAHVKQLAEESRAEMKVKATVL